MPLNENILERQLAGLKLASIFLGFIAILATVISILFPPYILDHLNQMYTLSGLAIGGYFISSYLFSNKFNYEYFAWSAVFVNLIFFMITDWIYDADYRNSYDIVDTYYGSFIHKHANLINSYYSFPSLLVVISTMYQRVSFVIIVSIAMLIGILHNILPTLLYESNFLTKDADIFSSNFNAIDEVFLSFNFQVFVFICIASFALVLLTSRLTNDVAKFERTNAQLGKYFSPSIRKEIERLDVDINKRPNKTQMIGIIFTDIIGFTKISEKLEPAEVLELLSEYQKKMTDAIFKNQGTVDKFIGDAAMATFGTPISRGNDAQNAFNCARDMQISMREWEKERSLKKQLIIKHRIGIHYGRCVVGNIGSNERMEFAVIGDTVNVASRICDACKEIKADILISDNLKNQLNEQIKSELIKNFKIRGREKSIDLHKITL